MQEILFGLQRFANETNLFFEEILSMILSKCAKTFADYLVHYIYKFYLKCLYKTNFDKHFLDCIGKVT